MSLLPKSKSDRNDKLSEQIILIYGRPKIGKSTLCSYFDNALFLATEPGLNHLDVFKTPVTSWQKFLDICKELASGNHEFKTVVIDTIDNLVVYCQEFVCNREDINHPSDYDYGKGWAMVTAELHRALSKLSLLPYGLVMIGHCKTVEVATKTKKFNKVTLDVSGANAKAITSLADIILYMSEDDIDGKQVGIIHTKPSLYYDGGDRSKLLPPSIEYSLDKPEEAYRKIAECFKNG